MRRKHRFNQTKSKDYSDLPRAVREQLECEARGEYETVPEVSPEVWAEHMARIQQMRENLERSRVGGQ